MKKFLLFAILSVIFLSGCGDDLLYNKSYKYIHQDISKIINESEVIQNKEYIIINEDTAIEVADSLVRVHPELREDLVPLIKEHEDLDNKVAFFGFVILMLIVILIW